MKQFSILIFISLLFSSCASNYHLLQPRISEFSSFTENNEGVRLDYQSEVMNLKRNKKQVKQEIKYNLSVINVRITNHSGNLLEIGENVRFYSGDKPLFMYYSNDSYKQLNQKWGYHLFYLGLTPLSGTFMVGGLYAAGPIGLVLGPGLAIFNSLKARKANRLLQHELAENSLIGKKVLPGKSLSGIIVIEGKLDAPLYLKQP